MQVEFGLRSLIAHQRGGPRQSTSIEITIDERPHLDKIQVPLSDGCPFHDWHGALIGSPDLATQTTVARLLESAQQTNAPRSALVLDWPLCTMAKCLDCGHSWHPMLRIALVRKKGACPACQSHSIADQQSVRTLAYGGPWASFTLAQLGLPERHLHSVELLSGAQ